MSASFRRIIQLFLFSPLLFSAAFVFAAHWINPREVLKDPMIARLQQGRKELTPREREEIEKYGYTGLEIMTYGTIMPTQARTLMFSSG